MGDPEEGAEQEFSLFGNDLFGRSAEPGRKGQLAKDFVFPPFTVLSARDGAWQERKRAWLSLGIKSELGRMKGGNFGEGVGGEKSILKGVHIHKTEGTNEDWKRVIDEIGTGASIFDPVLTELMYRWFCPEGGLILDPFAGGSVRGLVAGLLGYRYLGIDLSDQQVDANLAQRDEIMGAPTPDAPPSVTWWRGDSTVLAAEAPTCDFVFTCPPYGDLEQYTDNPLDLSTMEYDAFIEAYSKVIHHVANRLRDNRMACFVVGDFRDRKTGLYRGFVADTIAAFRGAKMGLYNEAILVTSCGTLPLRVSAFFRSGRKLGKTHQNALIFAKGDPRLTFPPRAE